VKKNNFFVAVLGFTDSRSARQSDRQKAGNIQTPTERAIPGRVKGFWRKLVRIIEACPKLSVELRQAIVKMVR
jgi:hypothetical protein